MKTTPNPTSSLDTYTYCITYSLEDAAYIGTVVEFPALSADGPTPAKAYDNIRHVVADAVKILESEGKPVLPCSSGLHIPESFKLFGQTILVRFDPSILGERNSVGLASPDQNIIRIASATPAYPRNPDQVTQVFIHELVHFILDFMGEHKLSRDEQFVDIFAHLLHQAFSTQSGTLKDSLPSKP